METGLRLGYLGTARRKGRKQTNQTYCYRATSLLYRKYAYGMLPQSCLSRKLLGLPTTASWHRRELNLSAR